MEFRENSEPYPVVFQNLGMIGYSECLDLQERTRQEIIDNPSSPGKLFFLEHPPTYTHGKLADDANLLADAEALKRQGVAVHRIDRGGDYTYHGPGQLVAYPIFDLKRLGLNVREHCHALEEVVIRVLREFGIESRRHPRYMGVWVGEKKICAIGVGVRKWVTKHGFAFNINTDMDYFNGIIPCGLKGLDVTSLQQLLGSEQDWGNMVKISNDMFIKVYKLIQVTGDYPG